MTWAASLQLVEFDAGYNHIRFDVVVAVGPDLVPPALRSENRGNKRERREAREELATLVDPVLALFTDEWQVR